MTMSYQDFIKESENRQPLFTSLPVVEVETPFFLGATAPTGGTNGSMWYNTSAQEGKLYIKYENSWIGIK